MESSGVVGGGLGEYSLGGLVSISYSPHQYYSRPNSGRNFTPTHSIDDVSPPDAVSAVSLPHIRIRPITTGRGLVVEGQNLYDNEHLVDEIKKYLEREFQKSVPTLQYNPHKGTLHLSVKPADIWRIDESRIEEIVRNFIA